MDLDTLQQRTNSESNLLFLLVGDNPLPNYVVAKLLAGTQTTIILVYSPKTGHLAGSQATKDNLLEVLTGTVMVDQLRIETLEVEESNAHSVATAIKKRVSALPSGLVLMNYTGGTKAMATHAYAAARAACGDTRTLYGCYLDARQLQLWIEDWSLGSLPKSTPFSVNQRLELKFETMLALHGRSGTSLRREPLLPCTAALIARLHADETSIEKYQRWLAKTFFQPWKWKDATEEQIEAVLDLQYWAYGKGGCDLKWQKRNRLLQTKFHAPLGLDVALQADLHAEPFQTWADLFVAAESYYGANLPGLFRKGKDDALGKWFEGQWLEDYVLKEWLAQPEAVHGDALAGASIDPTESDFEIDVALVRGYQLFAISCTTDTTKGLCKAKLLEVYARAEQLGGAEARVGLLAFFDKPTKLAQEVKGLVNEQRLQIFTGSDVPTIGAKLAAWVRDSVREQQ